MGITAELPPTDPDDLCWGAAAIASAIGIDKRRAYYLLERKKIPARQIGRTWVASKRALYAYIVGPDVV
jgi:hypothetical protein